MRAQVQLRATDGRFSSDPRVNQVMEESSNESLTMELSLAETLFLSKWNIGTYANIYAESNINYNHDNNGDDNDYNTDDDDYNTDDDDYNTDDDDCNTDDDNNSNVEDIYNTKSPSRSQVYKETWQE